MRIVSWNILNGGQDGTSTERLECAISVLRDEQPDVVLLQEANGFALHGQRLLYHIENSLNMRGFLAVANTGYNLAMYLRRDQAVTSYDVDATHFFHASLNVELVLPGSPGLSLVNAHLCPHSSEVRAIEAQHLARYAAMDSYVLIGGDLNSLDPHQEHSTALDTMPPHYRARYLVPGEGQQPDTRVGRILEVAGLIDIGYARSDPTYTIPTYLPVYGNEFGRLRLDYMYASSAFAELVTDYRVIRNAQTDKCSDHYPITIEVCVPEGTRHQAKGNISRA